MHRRVLIVNTILALALLALALYQLYLVTGRWVAVFHYLAKFGSDRGPWITLGFNTVIFGSVSLLIVGFFSYWSRRKAKGNKDSLSVILSTVALGAIVIAAIGLLTLIILPTIGFRR